MELLHESGEVIAQRYRICAPLGQGGSGTTYLAQDLECDRQVALKALSLRRMTDWKRLELFEREARVLAQLNHPAIPRYLDYFHVDTHEDRSFYIAQQLAEGQSLAALVNKGWYISEVEVRQIATQLLEILIYLHSLMPPVIHRDIKPQNIIRREDGQVFLVDFGAVQDTYHSTLMGGSTVVGTFGYMAPEQFRAQAVPTTDLYGLGATLLFLLTHCSPADLPTHKLKIDFRSHVQISEEFADWLEKLLEPDVADRFPSAKEALFMLHNQRPLTAQSDSSLLEQDSLLVPPVKRDRLKPQGFKYPKLSKWSNSLTWKTSVGVGVATVASVVILNPVKYPILSALQLTPSIHQAILKGDIGTVKDYLNYGGDVNLRNGQGSTPLHAAIASDRKELVRLLIAKGADINARDSWGMTPLHWALQSGNQEVAELVLAKGANVDARDSWGMTALHRALQSGKQHMAELLLTKGADVNAKDNQGYTPLHSADSPEIAELLLLRGASVNAKDNLGYTPLHVAAENHYGDVVELLKSYGGKE
jgi:serine/threonine protein kinase